MPRCRRVFGLGMGHVQAILLSLAVSVDKLIENALAPETSLERNAPDSRDNSPVQLAIRNKMKDSIVFLNQLTYLCIGSGRLAAVFLLMRFNNKYLFLIATVVEMMLLLAAQTLYLTSGEVGLVTTFLIIVFLQSISYPFSLNILSRWTTQTRATFLFGLFEASAFLLQLGFENLVESFQNYGFSGAFAHILFSVMVKGVFCVLWMIFGAQDPTASSFISAEEVSELKKENGRLIVTHWKRIHPWKSIFSTPIFYGIALSEIGTFWATELEESHLMDPTTLYYETKSDAILIGYLLYLAAALVNSRIVDELIKRNASSITNIRKTCSAITAWGCGCCLLLLGYTLKIQCNTFWLIIYYIFRSVNFVFDGFLCVFSVTPNYAGVVYALISAIAYYTLVLKFLVDYLVVRNGIFANLFYMTGLVRYVTNLVLLCSGSLHVQEFDSFGTVEWKDESIVSFP